MTVLKLILVLSVFIIQAPGVYAVEDKMTREPAVAGQFYPADKNQLSEMLDGFFSKTKKQDFGGEIIGIISPHAGYVFSAQTAAWVFKQIEGRKTDTVVLVGSSHKYLINGAAVWSGGDFLTPLGKVQIDEDSVKTLIKEAGFIKIDNNVHKPEHSLEVQIPFLQKMLGNFKILPILINDVSYSQKTAEAIAQAVKGKNVLLVASSDMTHYPNKKNAEIIDSDILKKIEGLDVTELEKNDAKWMSQGIPNLSCTLCGLPAVAAVMYASKLLGCDKAKTVHYSNSAESKYGDADRVVGYGSAVFVKSAQSKTQAEQVKQKEFSLTKESQTELLKIARGAIECYLSTGKIPSFSTKNREILNKGAVFVTLEKKHNLRGCIGTTEARTPLFEAVAQLAIAAAVEDSRFSPVTKDEMDDIKIEISVLSPLQKISSPDEITEGKHGVVVRKGSRSGLFLPQVWEHPELAKKEAFLSELCWQKAGLEPDAWKKGGADMYIFTVFAFKE